MDDRITEALRGSQGHHPAPPPPGVEALDRAVGRRRRRELAALSLTAAALVLGLVVGNRAAPVQDGPSRAVRDAAVAEALGEVVDDLDLLAAGPGDDDLLAVHVALLDPYAADPYAADTGTLIDPLNLDGEL